MKKSVGFISAPGWLDPAPDECRELANGEVAVQRMYTDPPDFDYSTAGIAECVSRLTRAAQHLAAAGRTLIASPATRSILSGITIFRKLARV